MLLMPANYQTQYSSFRFQTPDDIRKREAFVDEQWAVLAELSKAKVSCQ